MYVKIISLFFGILIFFGTMCYIAACQQNKRLSRDVNVPIISVFKESQMSGSFILGCGGFSNEMYYFVYIKKPNNSLIFKKFKAGWVEIYEDSDSPHIICDTWNGDIHYNGSRKIEIHVPPNTITREFKL